ncbi:carbamoyltransferase C-terminal domain-containing protein, partial [Candidatus Omnitrophota bacterium]
LCGIKNVCAAGGVFLNVKGNKLIREKAGISSLFVYPDSGDAGLSVGAALELYYEISKQYVKIDLKHTYFGTEYSNDQIETELKRHDIKYSFFDDIEKETAKLISEGHVIGWFQGRMEMGPRALGDRSVIADSRNNEIKERINAHLKKREWFVPFAPSVIDEDAARFVKGLKEEAPFMLMAYDAEEETKPLIPAVVHVDGTLRPQIVKKEINPRYWKLINEFKKITGIGVVVNTSFNRHRLPIVESPKDAVEHLLNGHIEKLVIGNYLVELVN